MARSLGMSSILVNRFSGVLSAYGLSAADVVFEKQEACAAEYGDGGEEPPEVGSWLVGSRKTNSKDGVKIKLVLLISCVV